VRETGAGVELVETVVLLDVLVVLDGDAGPGLSSAKLGRRDLFSGNAAPLAFTPMLVGKPGAVEFSSGTKDISRVSPFWVATAFIPSGTFIFKSAARTEPASQTTNPDKNSARCM